MAKNCCICDKKIGFMDASYVLGYGMAGYETCAVCKEHKDNLRGTAKERKDAIQYLSEKITRPEIEARVKEYVLQSFKSDEEKSKEQEEVKQRTEKLHTEGLMTSGYNFEGYKITAYKGLVSGEVVMGTGMFSEMFAGIADVFGTESDAFAEKIINAKRAAQDRLLKQVINVGGNAVIGVDYDYITFANNMIGISANGTAVIVEQI